MCGILFIKDNNLNLNKAKQALSVIKHRGPDSTNTMAEDNMFLGHNRLSIIDLDEKANQPMAIDNGKIILIFNGEIYNYQELKQKYNIPHILMLDE